MYRRENAIVWGEEHRNQRQRDRKQARIETIFKNRLARTYFGWGGILILGVTVILFPILNLELEYGEFVLSIWLGSIGLGGMGYWVGRNRISTMKTATPIRIRQRVAKLESRSLRPVLMTVLILVLLTIPAIQPILGSDSARPVWLIPMLLFGLTVIWLDPSSFVLFYFSSLSVLGVSLTLLSIYIYDSLFQFGLYQLSLPLLLSFCFSRIKTIVSTERDELMSYPMSNSRLGDVPAVVKI